MALQEKPTDINKIWAAAGAVIKPSDSKINEGYVAEIPTHQNFNWLMNLFGEFCKHVNQSGIPVWDATTQYVSNSIVKGVDGNIYFAKQDNVNKDPSSSIADWQISSLTTPEIRFKARLSAPVDVAGPEQKVIFDSVSFNRGDCYSDGTFVSRVNGEYLFGMSGEYTDVVGTGSYHMLLKKNGNVELDCDNVYSGGTLSDNNPGVILVELNVGDEVEVFTNHNYTSAKLNSNKETFFWGTLLSVMS